MKSNAFKRIMLCLIVMSSGITPGIACLSGAQQTAIADAFAGTATTIFVDNVEAIIPTANTGNKTADALWNGGSAWLLGLLQTTINTIVARQHNFAIPDDPFPGP
jgi:hypothetical protein